VAANRPNSFAKELVNNGFDVIVVTRHWRGDEQVWEDYLAQNDDSIVIEKKEGLTIHRLPYLPTVFSKNSLISKWRTFLKMAAGQLNSDVNYYQYKAYIDELLTRERVDVILVSIPPLNALKLCSELSKKHKVKFFVDVRDFLNFTILYKNPNFGFFHFLKNEISLLHSVRWFKKAALIFTITPPTTKYLRNRTKKRVITIMNGYQEKLLSINIEEFETFHITLIGSLYEIPEFGQLLDGFRALFKENFAKEITVKFIGTSTSPHIIHKIGEAIPARNLIMLGRLPQEDAQTEAAKSQILLVLGFKNMTGVLGTKTFEYLGLRKTIIQMPGDKDIMEKIILECNAGHCPGTVEEFVETIRKCFHEWKEKGELKYYGNLEKIKKYSREEQFKELLPYFHSI